MPILELDRVTKSFGALKVADAISFAVEDGEALGIIGPNGAGKSTLFNLVTGNLALDGGGIRFLGRDVTRLPPMRRCADGLGRTFQIPQPFGKLTVFENLLVAATFGSGALGGGGRRALRRHPRSRPASPSAPTCRPAASPSSSASASNWRARSPPTRSCSSSTRSPAA